MTTQLALTLEATTTQPKRRKAPVPLEPAENAPQARTGAAAGSMCSRCGQGPVRPGQRCGWCGKRAAAAPAEEDDAVTTFVSIAHPTTDKRE